MEEPPGLRAGSGEASGWPRGQQGPPPPSEGGTGPRGPEVAKRALLLPPALLSPALPSPARCVPA